MEIFTKPEMRGQGVYYLSFKGEIVYIGSSKCMMHRIGTHFKEGVKQFDSFRCTLEKDHIAVERDKIIEHMPKYNKIIPAVEGEHSQHKINRVANLLKRITGKTFRLRNSDYCDTKGLPAIMGGLSGMDPEVVNDLLHSSLNNISDISSYIGHIIHGVSKQDLFFKGYHGNGKRL